MLQWRMKWVNALLKLLLLAVLALAAALAANTWHHGSRQVHVAAITPPAVDERAAGESLAAAIRARTVSSYDDAQLNADQFAALHAHLTRRYPTVHAALKREVVGDFSLLYKWEGSDPNAAPIALMAHQDVVPMAPGTEADCQAEPFGGVVKDGFVWGRGAWDSTVAE